MQNRMRELRKKEGWNQSDLAALLGISPSAVGMYEQGRRDPDTAMLLRIAHQFNVSVDYLIGVSDSPGRFDVDAVARNVAKDLMNQPSLMFSADCYTEEELNDIRAVIEASVETALRERLSR